MRRLGVVVAGLLLLPACGLPTSDGPRSGGGDARDRPAGIKVLPPGPQPGASAEQVVRGFLAAQVSPDDDFAVARQFLAPGADWEPDGAVDLFDPGSPSIQAGDDGTVRLSVNRTALLSQAGAYLPLPTPQPPSTVPFTVEAQPGGELRITSAPAGLRLRAVDLDTSFSQQDVFFLGALTPQEASSRLVADRRFLRRGGDTTRSLVQALVDGPSEALGDAVRPVVPPGTRLRGTSVDDERVATVDLSAEVGRLSRRDLQRLSAALVWTLADLEGVRLLVAGRPVQVEGAGEVQTVEDWQVYDPSGLPGPVSLHYVRERGLRVQGRSAGQGDATSGVVQVDEVAVDPAGARLAVLTQGARPQDPDELRIGGLEGPLGPPVLRRPGLGSLSWGSGERGLFLLETLPTGTRLLLVPTGGGLAAVPVPDRPGAGPLTRAEVSRDGVRVALVYGTGDGRSLYVGRLQPGPGTVRLVDPKGVAPELTGVVDVAWESGTSLAVIAQEPNAAGLLVLQVAVDGSGYVPLPRPGVNGVPVALAAAPGQPIAVAVAGEAPGSVTQLYADDGQVFEQLGAGSAPTYPG